MKLSLLRREIDEIDSQIVSLFVKRSQIVHQVKELKDSRAEKSGEYHLHIKPDREFDVIANVLNLAKDSLFSCKFFFHTWRGVISASNFLEQNLSLVATCDASKYSLFEYYAMQKQVEIDKTQAAFAKIETNDAHILAFHKSNAEAFEFLKKSKKITIFAQSSGDTFLCGKVLTPHFASPALAVTLNPSQIVINKEAGVFASENIDDICQASCIGAFYPYWTPSVTSV